MLGLGGADPGRGLLQGGSSAALPPREGRTAASAHVEGSHFTDQGGSCAPAGAHRRDLPLLQGRADATERTAALPEVRNPLSPSLHPRDHLLRPARLRRAALRPCLGSATEEEQLGQPGTHRGSGGSVLLGLALGDHGNDLRSAAPALPTPPGCGLRRGGGALPAGLKRRSEQLQLELLGAISWG